MAAGKPIELWWQDEARIGQKTRLTRRWAKRGSRPSAPMDQRTRSAWLFGRSARPRAKLPVWCCPAAIPLAMNPHLAEVSRMVAPGAHAVILLDPAGWHRSRKLQIPDNISLMPLPPKCPEHNPVENIWQYIRDNWLSNRIFDSYQDNIDHCCHAWNQLVARPWLIMSIGFRGWAHGA